MENFSSVARLTDISDLNQSAALCVNPIQVEKSNQKVILIFKYIIQ